jgi:hypothetical protein
MRITNRIPSGASAVDSDALTIRPVVEGLLT